MKGKKKERGKGKKEGWEKRRKTRRDEICMDIIKRWDGVQNPQMVGKAAISVLSVIISMRQKMSNGPTIF